MPIFSNNNEIQTLLTGAKEILIVTHENPNQDSLGASLALYLSLKAANKNVTIACPTPSTVEFTNLVGIDKLSQVLGGRNFIISLDYTEGSIDKVSYNIEGNKFNLVIEPRPGAPAFTPEKVHYSSSAASPDVIFVIDCANLQQLGKFYQDGQELYSKSVTINIDYHPNNTNFGKINLINPNMSSTSEIVTLFIQSLGLPFNEDMATNLLNGIEMATNKFMLETTSAEAFEAAAICLKAGGKRITTKKQDYLSQETPADWLQPKIFNSKKGTTPQDVTPKDGSSLL
ncbi:MAG: DHH family phosphoesterase [Candidatus Gottesmanbacteria bacterium]